MILRSNSLMPWLLLGSLIFFIFFIFSQSSSSPPFRKKELKQRFTGGWTPWCDLSNGSWVRDTGSSHGYTNQTCKSLPESKNCRKYGKKGDYERWRWKPEGCELPRFNAAEFLEISKGKRLAFIGDSVARNQADSLVCFLSEVRLAISYPIGENSGDDNLQSNSRRPETTYAAETKNAASNPPPLPPPPFSVPQRTKVERQQPQHRHRRRQVQKNPE